MNMDMYNHVGFMSVMRSSLFFIEMALNSVM